MVVLEIYLEILTNFFEILHLPLYASTFKEGTFISDAVEQWLSLVHCFDKQGLNTGYTKCGWVLFYEECSKCLIYLGYCETKQWIRLVREKELKANINLLEQMSAKLKKIREYFINPKIQNEIQVCKSSYR